MSVNFHFLVKSISIIAFTLSLKVIVDDVKKSKSYCKYPSLNVLSVHKFLFF